MQKRITFFHENDGKKENRHRLLLRALAALSAGFLNGLLGTGGGVPLYFVLSREGLGKKAYATASVGILLLSLQTVFLYRSSAFPPSFVSPFLPFLAVVGGTLGALLLGRINTRLLRVLFSLLLIASGIYVVGKELYLAFFV